MPSILFVCTANICRSPMAAALFRLQLKKTVEDWQNWRIDSAGTWASDGQEVSSGSCEVMKRRGVDLTGHQSKTVTKELLEQFDLVLTMEQGHKEALQVEFPHLVNRVFMLSEMQGLRVSVRDPYGGPLTAYEVAADTLERMISKGMGRILSLASSKQTD
jgi:protein-tyrosine-phosphatase